MPDSMRWDRARYVGILTRRSETLTKRELDKRSKLRAEIHSLLNGRLK